MDRLHNPKLQPLIYTGPFAVGSDLDANLRVTKGNITGESLRMTVPVGGLFVDIPGGHDPKLDFNVNDELTFSQSFRDELVRHHMFKRVDLIPLEVPSAPDARSSPPVQITLTFASSYHHGNNFHLTVTLNIEGGKEFTKRYEIHSSEGDTGWERANTDNFAGKAKAAVKLLNKLMPDVEGWILENVPPTERVTQ